MDVYESDAKIFRTQARYLDPLIFWYEKRDVYKRLSKLAIRMLSVPSTSVLSEQCFSGAGRIATH